MNFFGHAVVAGWANEEAGGVLGSMLPDFEAMVSVRLIGVSDQNIRRGIDFHHQTDEVFHQAPTFLSLTAGALADMAGAGIRRGTARAIGHIGSEMFLDGWLTQNEHHVGVYLGALYPELADRLEWEDRGHAFSKLLSRLANWGAPREYRDPSFVYGRLCTALKSRPRLAVLEEESDAVARFLPALRRTVERRAPELLNELRDALGLEH